MLLLLLLQLLRPATVAAAVAQHDAAQAHALSDEADKEEHTLDNNEQQHRLQQEQNEYQDGVEGFDTPKSSASYHSAGSFQSYKSADSHTGEAPGTLDWSTLLCTAATTECSRCVKLCRHLPQLIINDRRPVNQGTNVAPVSGSVELAHEEEMFDL